MVFDIALIKSILPDAATMKINTIVGFLCAVIALGFLRKQDDNPLRKRLGAVFASLLVLIAALTLS